MNRQRDHDPIADREDLVDLGVEIGKRFKRDAGDLLDAGAALDDTADRALDNAVFAVVEREGGRVEPLVGVADPREQGADLLAGR